MTVLTVGILAVFSYLKEYFESLALIRSLRYTGDVVDTFIGFCSNASVPIHMQCWEINPTQKTLIARRIVIENNHENSILQFFQFLCICLATEMPYKGTIVKI